jgi:Tfp pilus assembly protein PilF
MTQAVLLLALLAMAGCASMGPGAVTRDRFDSTAGLQPAAAQVQPPKPQPPEKHYEAARAALMGGDRAKALREVKLALQDNPLDAASHFLLGCLLQRTGENDQAIVGFDRALALDPADPAALYNLGTMLLWRKETVPASRLLESAVLIRPDHVPSYNNLAKAYFLAGLPELSVATYGEALRRDPSNAIARKNLLLLTEAAGIHDAAATYPRRLEALRLGPAEKPPVGTAEPMTPLPSRPIDVATAATEQSPVAAPAPGIARDDTEAAALRELVRDLPHVTVERRGGRLTVTGWTSGPKERAMLDRILGKDRPPLPPPPPPPLKPPPPPPQSSAILDLTSDDTGDPQRMLEIDAVLFVVRGLIDQNLGFNFLKQINITFNYFATDHAREGTGFPAPGMIGAALAGLQSGWIFGAAADYVVNIANAQNERVAVLARPHLTALSGTSAKFLAGGELIFKVSGLNSGDIKIYPFGTTLTVTPTLLRMPAEDGAPRVHLAVEAGRTSVLALLSTDPDQPTVFDKVTVASEAVLAVGQTLILSGLSQRESRKGHSGVPILRDIPILKYLFSTETLLQSDAAVIILLTPRDAAFWDERNRQVTAEFVEKRRAFLLAKRGTEEDMRRFRERYPDWQQLPPNRFGSHLFMLETSEIYRTVSGQALTSDDIDLQLLGPNPNK